MASRYVQQIKHIWTIAGPAGCGKSTVAFHIAQELKIPFLEGDDFHTDINKEKMKSGVALTDEDRWEWLDTLREAAKSEIRSGHPGVVISCSALKTKYRNVLREAVKDDVEVHFVYLHANQELLVERVKQRQGHYMKEAMVRSQLKDLEEPTTEEKERDCLIVDVSGPSDEVQARALEAVKAKVTQAAATTHAKTSTVITETR